jgi:hypothetical protein
MAMDPLGRYVLTAGVDGLLRLWACLPLSALRPRSLPPHQAFVGHPSAVLGEAGRAGQGRGKGRGNVLCCKEDSGEEAGGGGRVLRVAGGCSLGVLCHESDGWL